jgi:phosphatidylglycerophosphatase A
MSSAESSMSPRGPLWAVLVSTFFGIGRMRPGPGTWGSATTVLLWAAIARGFSGNARTAAAIGFAIGIVLLSIPAATQVARATGRKDPQFIVIDEVAGQIIALIAVPLTWQAFLAAFILFRVFDILKPPPVRQLERLPGGTGIVLDDVAAGIYALVLVQLLLHLHLLK